MKKLIPFLLIFAILFCGCAGPAAETLSDPVPTPTLSEFPESLDLSDAEVLFLDEWEKVTFSSDMIPEEIRTTQDAPLLLFMEDYEERTWLITLQNSLAQELSSAVETCAEKVAAHYDTEISVTEDLTAPSWQLLYTIIRCGMGQMDFTTVVKSTLELDVTFQEQDERILTQITISLKDYQEVIAQLIFEKSQQLSAESLYSYLYTAYNENAEMTEYTEREPGGNLSNITWPLESHTRLRKTWYADRDKGTRRHMGTDIWAKEDTEIYSCTDGVVTFIGSGDKMGNAVIVEDAYGYEYHYYHMVRITDFLQEGDSVKAGELVGHVGNTGNSSRDHLHLTIIAPDGYYINPYPYLEPIEP